MSHQEGPSGARKGKEKFRLEKSKFRRFAGGGKPDSGPKPTQIIISTTEARWNFNCRLMLLRAKDGERLDVLGVKFVKQKGDTPEKVKTRVEGYNMKLKFDKN